MDALANHFRERAVAYLIARNTPQASESTVPAYGPVAEENSLRKRLEAIDAIPADERCEAIAEQLAGLRAAEEVVLLGEIHPSWLVDVLAHESPRVVGMLLRFLPSQHARYVLDHLPRQIKDRLPHVVDAFAVSDTIVRVVRRKFEAHFLPVRPSPDIDTFDGHQLHLLSLEDLKTLFHDLGLHELAIAFCHVSRPALRVLLNRLDFSDAKELQRRIRTLYQIDAHLERDARYSILEMSLEGSDPEALIREIGLQAFAKSLLPAQLPMVGLIKQKLPPELAYLLQRDTDIHVPSNHIHLSEQRKYQILLRVGALSHEGTIDTRWWRLLPETIRSDFAQAEDNTAVMAKPGEEDVAALCSDEQKPDIRIDQGGVH